MHSISAVSRITKPITPAMISTMEGIPVEGPDRGSDKKEKTALRTTTKNMTRQQHECSIKTTRKMEELREEGKAKKFGSGCAYFKNGLATKYLYVIYAKRIYNVDKIDNSSTNRTSAPSDTRAKVSSMMFATTCEVPLCKPSFNSAILTTIIRTDHRYHCHHHHHQCVSLYVCVCVSVCLRVCLSVELLLLNG